ncbi:MAG: SpvB/TcaC N-terminal domain-containing protein [Chitinophagaceae bacterium]
MKISLPFVLTIYFLGAVVPTAWSQSDLYTSTSFVRSIDLSKGVGTTEGVSGVSSMGAGTYTVPLVCAPGTNGISPKVSFSYNSNGSNGLMGVGWSVEGLSVITRRGTDLFHDGVSNAVTFSNSDIFILDGQRLDLKSGSKGARAARIELK